MQFTTAFAILTACMAGLLSTACSTAFETPSTLSRDDLMVPGERRLVPVLEYADGEALAGIDVLYIPLADIAPGARIDPQIEAARLDRLRAALSKALCRRFARGGFAVSPAPAAEETGGAEDAIAVARLHAAVTGLRENNVATTGLSRAIGVAVPGPLNPRVPIGIGALGVEGEIRGPDGRQLAAMRWAAQNHLVSGGGYTTLLDGPEAFGSLADATELSEVFADAFGDLVVNARAGHDLAEGETPRGTCDAYFDRLEAEAETGTGADTVTSPSSEA